MMIRLNKLFFFMMILLLISGCSSKKYELRLNGIQNQITYLNESYNKLSLRLSEIQDSLLVLQYQVDNGKNTNGNLDEPTDRKEKSIKDIKSEIVVSSDSRVDPNNSKVNPSDLKQDEIPIFELGAVSQGLDGKPGEVFTLDGGEGYIRIEGEKNKSKDMDIKTHKVKTADGPESVYNNAYESYSKRNFDKAIDEFLKFLKIYPEHDLSDNALYWIGESYVGKGEYALALPEFQRVTLEYPNGNKVPDSLLMIGICFEKLNNKENALKSWNKLVSLFPSTIAAKKAEKKLEAVNKQEVP